MKSSNFSAVALKYPQDAEAPFISAKEKGALARRMIEIAEENNIPVIEDKIVNNVLSLHEVGECIPEETWRPVAAIFAYMAGMEKDNGNSTET